MEERGGDGEREERGGMRVRDGWRRWWWRRRGEVKRWSWRMEVLEEEVIIAGKEGGRGGREGGMKGWTDGRTERPPDLPAT